MRQMPTDINPFLGAWHLANWTVTAGDGTTTYPYTEQAQSQLVHTASGQMSAQLMRPSADLARWADLDGESALQELGQTTSESNQREFRDRSPKARKKFEIESHLALLKCLSEWRADPFIYHQGRPMAGSPIRGVPPGLLCQFLCHFCRRY